MPRGDLELCAFNSKLDYDKQQAGSSATLRLRRCMEASLTPAYDVDRTFEVSAFCVACAKTVKLLCDYEFAFSQSRDGVNWRERLVCPECGLNCRLRASFSLLRMIGCDQRREIYITEQVTPFFKVLRGHYPKLVGSEFLRDGTLPGHTSAAGTRCEDATSLTFPSNRFDVVASFEVLEHVPDYERALYEFRRVLRPGGVLVLSVPFRFDLQDTLVRARLTEGDRIEHILPPEIHGDPLDQSGALCFYHFGWDLLDRLRLAGFGNAELVKLWSRSDGYLGQGNVFLVAYV